MKEEQIVDWTPENRLKLIFEIAAKVYEQNPSYDVERILYLSNMSDDFLEKNKASYAEFLEAMKAKITRVKL